MRFLRVPARNLYLTPEQQHIANAMSLGGVFRVSVRIRVRS